MRNSKDKNGAGVAVEKFVSWRLCGYLNKVLWLLKQFSDSGEEFCGVGFNKKTGRQMTEGRLAG